MKTLVGLFLLYQEILKDVDSVLYIDTDTIFMQPIDSMWELLGRFDSTQIAAIVWAYLGH